MTVIAIIPAVICILGLVLWAFTDRFKTPAIIMFASGLLVWLFAVARHVWKF